VIEVEKKFLLSDDEQRELLDGATLTIAKDITDKYFDDELHSLTKADRWLRERDESFELKLPLAITSDKAAVTNQYHELEDEPSIREALSLEIKGESLDADIVDAGFSVFCLCRTMRHSYKKDDFKIDVDTVTYGGSDFTYTIVEIEKMVGTEAEVQAAEDSIIAFAKTYNLPTDRSIPGKVIAFLKVENPTHYEELVAHRVTS